MQPLNLKPFLMIRTIESGQRGAMEIKKEAELESLAVTTAVCRRN